ncbi:hypothetical protein ILUMI_17366, partial [Ignelater luminosus]
MVLLKEDHLPPGQWRLGRIIQVNPGADEVIRAVTVKCGVTGEVKRALNKVLAASSSDTDDLSEESDESDVDNIVLKNFNTMVEQVKLRLVTAPAVAITTDGWTSSNNESFVALTAHYIESNGFVSSLLGLDINSKSIPSSATLSRWKESYPRLDFNENEKSVCLTCTEAIENKLPVPTDRTSQISKQAFVSKGGSDNDERTNLKYLLKARSEDVNKLKVWLNRTGHKWLHRDIQNQAHEEPAIKRWKFLRDKYVKLKRRYVSTRTGSDEENVHNDWVLMDELTFLDPYITQRKESIMLYYTKYNFLDGAKRYSNATNKEPAAAQNAVEKSEEPQPLSDSNIESAGPSTTKRGRLHESQLPSSASTSTGTVTATPRKNSLKTPPQPIDEAILGLANYLKNKEKQDSDSAF